MVKLIIFDAWGTLVNRAFDWPSEIVKLLDIDLTLHEFDMKSDNSTIVLKDCSVEEGWKSFLEQLKIKISREVFDNVVIIYKLSKGGATLYPDTLKILRYLRRKGYSLVLASNMNKFAWEVLKRKFSLDEYFDDLFLSFKLEIAKPNIQFFKKIIGKTGRKPSEIMMIGNTEETDIIPAANLGIQTVFINRHGIKSLKSNYNIRSLSELKNLL